MDHAVHNLGTQIWRKTLLQTQLQRNINTTSMEELNTLMSNTFLNLPFFPPFSYLPSSQSPKFVPWTPLKAVSKKTNHITLPTRSAQEEKENEELSLLEQLRRNNQELDEVLALFEEQETEAVILERLYLKEFIETTSTMILAYCPCHLTMCMLNLRGEKGKILPAVALNPIKEPSQMALMEKGKNPQTHNHSVMMIFIIWNTRGANSSSFRRHCDLMVKTHRLSLLVLLEIKMVEHKELTEELQFDAQI